MKKLEAMKNLYVILFNLLFMVAGISNLNSQNVTWQVRALNFTGKMMNVVAVAPTGVMYDVVAAENNGPAHFMELQVVYNNQSIPVKLTISDDMYVPVHAVTPKGELLEIKVVTSENNLIGVKGVARSGNLIRIAAVTEAEVMMPIRAVSADGSLRDIYGVKFSPDNTEMEIGTVKVMAHVIALPPTDVKASKIENGLWNVVAVDINGNTIPAMIIDLKGIEHPIKAHVTKGNIQVLDVKANYKNYTLPLYLVSQPVEADPALVMVDDNGRVFNVKAKTTDGELLDVFVDVRNNHVMTLKATSKNGTEYWIKALSPFGTMYDIMGIKMLNNAREGMLSCPYKNVIYFANVKALPPLKMEESTF